MYAKTVLLALLLAPVTALAAPHCKHSAERKLDLDLAGVKRVKFEVNSHDLRLRLAREPAREPGPHPAEAG